MGSLLDAYNKGKKSSTSSKTNNNTEYNNASQNASASATTQASKGSSLLDAYNRGKNMGAAASTPKTTTTTVKRDDGTVKIHALGAGETKPTTSRVGKTINAGVQGTMSNFANFWGWLKESDAAARARDEADKEYTERQNKQLAETKGEKATAKTEEQQKQKYAENHAKQKDNWSKDYEEADKLSAMSEKNVAEAKEGLGKVGQALVDIGVVGTQMLGDAVLNIIPGGGTASMIARVAGAGAQQARLEGKDIGQQSLSAIKSGGIAWLTEKMFGAFGKLYGKGAADDVVEAVVRRIGKTNAGKNFLRLGLNALGEGAEEITEDLLNAAADRALKLGNGELDLGEVLYDGFLGFALGGLGTGVQILNAQKVLAKTVAKNTADPETVKMAEAMTQKLNGGEMLTTAEAETLVGALEASTNAEETAETARQGEVTPNEKKPITPVEAVTRVAQGKVGNENEQLNIDNTDEQIEALPNSDEVLAQQQSNLPEGMGAASAEFTGEMTPAEKWVAEAQGKGDNALHDISDAAQRNLAEQQGRAPQEMPKVDLNGMLTSKTANTVQNSGVTPQDMSDAILNDAANSRFSYYAYSDEDALTKAKDEIDAEGWDDALTKYQADVARGIVSKDMTVKGIVLYNNAVSNGDYVTALNILDGMVKTSRDAAQAMQAVNILNKLSPETRLYCICRGIDGIKRQVQKKYGKKAPDIEIDEALLTDYVQKMRNGDTEAAEAVWENIQQNIADQITSSWIDKLNAWRYLAMLGNPRTHIRNTVGNAFFSIPVMAKNVVATGIEAGVDKFSKNGVQRTKALLNPLTNKQDRALLAIAMADYANASEQILAGGKYDDIFSGVSDKQTVFKFKPLEAVRKFNSKALDTEDVWFAQPHYATALAGYLKANGISAVEFTNGSMSEAAMNEARNYAVKEAQKATFRDINPFSEMVSNLGKSKSKAANAAASAVLPFKKTPANILVRGVEYSPIGLVKGLADIRNIKTPNNPNGTKTAAEVIDELAAGLTGTGLVALGALLVRSGALTGGGGDDDKENKFQSLQGKQNYALVLPDGTTVTLDWLAPEVLPVFVGVELYNSLSGNGNSWENILAAISTIPQPMLDMSLLQSVNDLIDNVAYVKKGKGIYKIIAGMATSLLSQFVPTVFGQVERTIETERQQTFIDRSENAPSGAVQSFWARLNDKNPFYDYNKIPYIDAWGRTEETGTFAERFANNFFNPAYVKEASGTPIDSELQRLYELGKTSVYPTKPGTDVKINGEYLSAEEYVEYAKKRGSESLENVRELINSSAYKNMSDADKADAIKAAYDYADDIAKQYVRRGAKISSWVEKATASGNPSQYIADTIIMRTADTDGNDRYSNAEKVRGFMNGGYSGGELVEKVREYMTTENGNCRLGDMLERAQSVKVPDTVTLNVYEFYNNANSKDASGNTVSGLKKERVQQYINSLNSLTAEQKDALYYSLYKK